MVVKFWNHMPGAVTIRVNTLSYRPTQRLISYATATTRGRSSSLYTIMIRRKRNSPRNASNPGNMASSREDAMEKIKMDSTITTSRKLVPHLGWSRV